MFSEAALPSVELKQEKTWIFPRLLFHTDPRELGQLLRKSVAVLSQAGGAKLAESSTSELAARDTFTCLRSSGHRFLPLDCWGSQTKIFLKVSNFVAICLSLGMCAPHDSVGCANLELPGNSAEGTN